MRRSSSTTSRCGASSESVAGEPLGISASRLCSTVGARDQMQHAVAIVAVDHGGEKAARRLMRAGPEFGEGTLDARGLQRGKLERQRLAFGRYIKQSLAAVLRALLLHHEALI